VSMRITGMGSRWAALLVGMAIMAAACTPGADATPAPATPDAGTPGAETPAAETPAAEAFKLGYISLGDSVPFVKLVSDSIRRAAAEANQELVFCDSEIDAAKALDCARQMQVQGVEGVLNFQVFQDSSPEICNAYGSVPTIAIDIVQEPCQIAFMGANNREAGRLGGRALGEYARDNWNCEYTAYVSLESTAAGAANADRMGGYREGFAEFCEIQNERVLDGADRTDPALEQMTNLLGALPGNRIVVVAINEDGILGAIGAARTLGRDADLFYSGQGTDPSIWSEVACNPNYIASVAYFPERYGDLLIPNMIRALQGETIPEEIFTEHEVITRDNIRDIYPETPAC
jgi:ribose transport system substrate-binding protein